MKFTVITVVKNRVDVIKATIKSVLSQNYNDFEYIIFDANSTDGTSEEILKFKNKILYFREDDKSLYDALNKAYEMASGQVIGHLHAGDTFNNINCLKNISQKFNNNKIDLLSGNLKYINLRSKKITREWRYPITILSKNNVYKIPHTTIFLKKSILTQKNFYNIKYKISSDTDFLIRLSKLNLSYYYYDCFLIIMSDSGLSTSWNLVFKKINEDIKIYVNHFGIKGFFFYIRKVLYKIPSFFKTT